MLFNFVNAVLASPVLILIVGRHLPSDSVEIKLTLKVAELTIGKI